MNAKEINSIFNKHKSDTSFIKYVFNGLNTDRVMAEKSKKFAKAASLAIMDTYPTVPKAWKLIMIVDAVKDIFDGEPSVNTVKEYKRAGYLRGPKDEHKIYDGEAVAFKMIYRNIQRMEEMGIIKQELFEGKEHVIFFPANIPTAGLHKMDQKARAVKRVSKDPLWIAFLNHVDEE